MFATLLLAFGAAAVIPPERVITDALLRRVARSNGSSDAACPCGYGRCFDVTSAFLWLAVRAADNPDLLETVTSRWFLDDLGLAAIGLTAAHPVVVVRCVEVGALLVHLDRRGLCRLAHTTFALVLLGRGWLLLGVLLGRRRCLVLLPDLQGRARSTDEGPEVPRPLALQAVRRIPSEDCVMKCVPLIVVEFFKLLKLPVVPKKSIFRQQ